MSIEEQHLALQQAQENAPCVQCKHPKKEHSSKEGWCRHGYVQFTPAEQRFGNEECLCTGFRAAPPTEENRANA